MIRPTSSSLWNLSNTLHGTHPGEPNMRKTSLPSFLALASPVDSTSAAAGALAGSSASDGATMHASVNASVSRIIVHSSNWSYRKTAVLSTVLSMGQVAETGLGITDRTWLLLCPHPRVTRHAAGAD